MDNLTKEDRSKCMSMIRSKWTTQERKVHSFLKGNKIKHKMHPKIEGSPDIVLKDRKTAVFIHGCFWHKCPKCYIEPKSKKKYWLPKLEKNIQRDKKNKRALKKQGYEVIILWEHEIKRDMPRILKKILNQKSR